MTQRRFPALRLPRWIVAAGVILTLSACTTTVEKAGEQHRVVAEKWLELSKYAESDLRRYQLAITAELSATKPQGYKQYDLENIRLNDSQTRFNIDLLAPSFSGKYICNPVCSQLNELELSIDKTEGTLLEQFFDRHEFELFKFYGDVYLLNQKLAELEAIDADQVPSFLQHIIRENRQFDSLDGFASYLDDKLTVAAFNRYRTNRSGLSSEIALDYGPDRRNLEYRPNENAQWQQDYGADGQVPENKHWETAIIADRNWQSNVNQETKQWARGLQVESFGKKQVDPKERLWYRNFNWTLARKKVISEGDYVCSFDDNLFGKVISFEGSHIGVELIGEAKDIEDGIFGPAGKGALFGVERDIPFVPRQGVTSLPVNKVAVCGR